MDLRFGYGDGDDETVVPGGTVTVFARQSFAVEDPEQVERAFLHVDYDDAFVAYLNGEEVGRANVGTPGFPPGAGQTASADREAQWYQGLPLDALGVDLSGWSLLDEDDERRFVLSEGTHLEGGGYVVLCRAATAFAAVYPDAAPYLGDWDFGLDGGGELVRLLDADSSLVDSVRYDDEAPWPTEPDGEGPSLELIDPAADNALPQYWRASTQAGGTPGAPNGTSISREPEPDRPARFALLPNHPNPFREATTIRYSLDRPAPTRLHVYDVLGRAVRTLVDVSRPAGTHTVRFDARGLAGGVYLCRLEAGGRVQTRTMLLVRQRGDQFSHGQVLPIELQPSRRRLARVTSYHSKTSHSMKSDDVKVAVGQYLDLVVNGRGGERENVEALELLLDMLAWMQHLNEPAPEASHADSEPPEREFDKMRALIGEQYASFGPYEAPADPTRPDGETVRRHAVEDLADIACELFEVAWRFQNTSEADALRAFAESYEQRWRTPLRRVQGYLDAWYE